MDALAQAHLSAEEQRVLRRWIELLSAELKLDAVWLYGSRARGDANDDSDVDVLVIAPHDSSYDTRLRIHRLLERAAEEAGGSFLPFSVQLWDPDYLEHRREINSFFLQEVERDKVILFERGS